MGYNEEWVKSFEVCARVNSIIFIDVFGETQPLIRGIDTYSQARILERLHELCPKYKFYYSKDLDDNQFSGDSKYFEFMQEVYGHVQGRYRIFAIIPDSVFFKHENRQEAVSYLVEWQQKRLSDYAKMNDSEAINFINKRLNYRKSIK